MSITLEVNGTDYEGFTSVRVKRSFLNLASVFNFSSVSSSDVVFPLEVGDRCVVRVNNNPVLTGFIEKITVSYRANEHSISVEGRDKTCDLIDSTINDAVIYKPPITLRKVIQNSLAVLGITDIQVFENVSIAPFSRTEIQSAGIGDGFFSFLDKLCRLRQVIMTTDGLGNIALDQASKVQLQTILLGKIGNLENNIIASSSSFDFTQRFNLYRVFSQGNIVAFADVPQTPQQLTNKRGQTGGDPEIRTTRQYNFISEKSADNKELKNRAIWEANIRRALSKQYTAIVQGFTATKDNALWRPNRLVQIDDDFARTQGVFLLQDVTYMLTLDGSFTELTLVAKDAFTLQAEQDARDARVNFQGKGFVV